MRIKPGWISNLKKDSLTLLLLRKDNSWIGGVGWEKELYIGLLLMFRIRVPIQISLIGCLKKNGDGDFHDN